MSTRAEQLASRLEAGAALLTQLANSLSHEEWRIRVRDGRTVGVVIHHVASVYPVEMDLARSIASGQAVTGVTWEAVADMNAKHALEFADISKAATVALLTRNSQAAAAEIRTFTDAQLDSAAPFSLSFDAPMTAQFVLEDHPVRHSWHHMARIRAVLGRSSDTRTQDGEQRRA